MPQPTPKARLVLTALFVDHQTPAEVAAAVRRAPRLGLQAQGPLRSRGRCGAGASITAPQHLPRCPRARSRRPHRGDPQGTHRRRPGRRPETIPWHLHHHHGHQTSRSTISRHLTAAGLVTPEPKKRPKSSYIRFEASMPNETWQSDFTHYRLTRPDGRPGADVEIINWLDDCTRYALHVTAHRRVTGPHRHRHLPPIPCPARDPGLHTHRQRHGLHRQAGRPRPPRRQELLRGRAQSPTHRPEELPTATPPPAARPSDSSRR